MKEVTKFTLKEKINEQISGIEYADLSHCQNGSKVSTYYGKLGEVDFTDLIDAEKEHIWNR